MNIKNFKDKNPDYVEGKPCVYVGQSVHEPKVRLKQHLEGYKANRYAKKFGNFIRKKNTGVKIPIYLVKLQKKLKLKQLNAYVKEDMGYGVINCE